MALNRLPEVFCTNETKSCDELITFLNEQKEGEKSTHMMIKKHRHRRKGREILKLPKIKKHGKAGSENESSNAESETSEKTSLMRGGTGKSKLYHYPESASTESAD